MLKYKMMQYPPPVKPRTRNPITYQKHRREVFWQITVPLTVGAIFIIVLGATIAVGANVVQISKLASVSLISLIIPAMIFTVIAIVITVAGIYGLVRLIILLPFYTREAQNFLLLVRVRVAKVSDAVVEPFLRVHSWGASASQLKRSLRRKPPAA